jgi:LysR family hydrogen peroxide-inducible transcriptional activator
MRPSVRQLEYLVALADTLSFRRAAEACYVTQPALSAQIRALEEILGVRLFERDRRHVLATEAGREVVERARRVLVEIDALAEAARAFQGPLAGTLRLGVIPTVAPYVLPPVLPHVSERFPGLRVFLREEQTARLLDLLGRGELDLLLLALEAELGDVETLALFSDPFVLALPPGHRLARRKVVREEDLRDEPVLLLADGHCLRDQALPICRTGGARELGDFRASSLNTLVRMVSSGIGLTLLPSVAVPIEVRSADELAIRPLVRRAPARTIGFAWRRTSPRRPEFELLAEVFRAHLPEGARAVRPN